MPAAVHDGLQCLLTPLSQDLRAGRWQTRRRLPQFTEMKQLFADVFVVKSLAQSRITTLGPNGIGFANFGLVCDLHLQALIEIGLTLTGIGGKKTKKCEAERKVVCRIGILN